MVGLGSVSNTSDAAKPVSTAQAAADAAIGTAAAVDATSKANAAAAASTPVAHATNMVNPHGVTAAQVGLGNVTNTSDAAKPVSTLQAAAIGLKADQATTYTKTESDAAIAAVVGAAPAALNTLVEIAAQLAADETAAGALTAAVSLKAPIASPAFTGTVTGITAAMVGAPAGSGTSSGANTGDETLTTIKTKLSITTLSGSNTGDQILPTLASLGAQAAGTYATGAGSASGVNTADETTATIKTKLGITTLSGSNTGDQVLPTLVSLGATPQVLTTSGDIAYMGAGGIMQRLPASTIDNQTLTNHPNGTLSWQDAIPGKNATVVVGTVTTIASGSAATVTNGGDSLNAVFNFALPQGPAGIAGLAGSNSLLIAPFERWNIVSTARASLEVLQINIKTASVWKYTAASVGSFSINLRGDATTTLASLLAIGDSCTIVVANTCGGTPYFPSSFSIDGVQVFPKWSGGLSPNAGNSNSVDFYAYVISRESAGTYAIYANQTKYA